MDFKGPMCHDEFGFYHGVGRNSGLMLIGESSTLGMDMGNIDEETIVICLRNHESNVKALLL